MKVPLQVTVRDFKLPESIEAVVREKADKLNTFCDQIMGCRVVVEIPHRRQQKGILYNVRIDMTVPGAELVVKREPHADIHAAVREAFDAARRQLQDYTRRQRGEVKTHEEPPRARVHALLPEDGYGFLITADGREIYFHENSVLDGKFEQLKAGMEVRFVETDGEKGPQASTVAIL
jgi:ribosomal subunit interface protein